MKKVLCLILAVMMVSFLAVKDTAAGIMQSPDARINMAVWLGDNDSGATSDNSITLGPDQRIVGWKVSGDGAAGFAGLYDTDSTLTCTAATLFDEQACASDGSFVTWFAAPKELTTGLVVVMDASTTTVVVYYE